MGRWRGATSSALAGGACAVFLAEAAGLTTLSALAESTSLPLALALTAGAALGLARLAALWAAGALAGAASVAPASGDAMPVSSERSEESSGCAGGATLRRAGFASSTSRSCAHVVRMDNRRSAHRRRGRARASGGSPSRIAPRDDGKKPRGFFGLTGVPYLARGRAALAASGGGRDAGGALGA